jgi:L,D-peptidoglycan transpeptidase YkuD (ErfK/YbiS/YcfS/YnhG family)
MHFTQQSLDDPMPVTSPPLATYFQRVLLIGAAALLAACQPQRMTLPPGSNGWQASRQLVLVTIDTWHADHGVLRAYERAVGGVWHEVGAAQPVTIGKAGAAWGLGLHAVPANGPRKREGDNRSPAGVFRIGEAFGYAARADTALPYRALGAADYCVDVSSSPQYNRIVDANVVGAAAVQGSTEPMRRDLHVDGDQRYRLGFVIEHNTRAMPQGGSCIFAHLWQSSTDPTTGCTAMPPAVMRTLLAWLRPQQHPVFVLLPQAEYRRLQTAWQLPALGDVGIVR